MTTMTPPWKERRTSILSLFLMLRVVGLSSLFGAAAVSSAAAVTVDFSGIPIATSIEESKATFEDRRQRVLQWFANELRLPDDVDEDVDPDNNPFLDTRGDMRTIVNWATARIILSENVTAASDILLDARTVPLGQVGTSIGKNDESAMCHRRGDYDFALMNLLRLIYVAREHPEDRFSSEAMDAMIRRMLTVSGNDHSDTYELSCGPLLRLDLRDTENHILMIQVAQYLSNQLLGELPENAGNALYDNELNGNNEWMLDYLARHFVKDHFYEYNSRPYQGYSMLAFQLLHSYSQDERVSLAAEMILDQVSAWSGLQSNQLRRFAPFRRQPDYIVPDEIERRKGHFSWAGDAEAERLALLVGNYGHLQALNYKLPPGDGLRHFIMAALTSQYRLPDVLLDLAIRQDGTPRWFMANHDGVEIYAASSSALISAGGIFTEGAFLIEHNAFVMQVLGQIINQVSVAESGWAQPTTVLPTHESSANILDMIRFEGHHDLKLRENTCVAPGFACGLSPRLGNVLQAIESNCLGSSDAGHWRFFDFSQPNCPLAYQFHLALYEHPCETQRCQEGAATGTFGLLELLDADKMSFDDFVQHVLYNNPQPFSSSQGTHLYTTVLGRSIEFEIYPPLGESALIALDGEVLGRDYSQWPRARGDAIQSTTPGRFTIDSSPSLGQRLILDMVNPQQPRRFLVGLPILQRGDVFGSNDGSGVYFDDGGAVIPGKGVAWIALTSPSSGLNQRRLSGLAMGWTSGLEVFHHGTDGHKDRASLGDTAIRVDFGTGEFITEVALGGGARDRDGSLMTSSVGYMHVTTNFGQEITAGNVEDEEARFVAEEGQQIIAFHGRTGDDAIKRIGVIYAPI